jgi:hypothetical protein
VLGTAVAGLLVAASAGAAGAQERLLGGKLRGGEEVLVPADEVVSTDLVVAGGMVRVEGRVEGDLVAAGGQVSVPGTVTGDALLTGGSIAVSGAVDGDLRVAAGQTNVTGRVGEDLLVLGGQVDVASTGEVGQDLIFAAGEVGMDGRVAGNVLGRTGEYVRGGSVAGDENVTVEDREPAGPPSAGEQLLAALRRFLGILLVGALLLWLAPRLFRGAAQRARERPLPSLGLGLLGLMAPVAIGLAVIFVAVLTGLVLGLLGLGGLVAALVLGAILMLIAVVYALFVTVAWVAPAVVGLGVGRLLLPGDDQPAVRAIGTLALGVLIVAVLVSLPTILGVLLRLLIVLLGLGALLLGLRLPRRRPAQASPVAASQPEQPVPPSS